MKINFDDPQQRSDNQILITIFIDILSHTINIPIKSPKKSRLYQELPNNFIHQNRVWFLTKSLFSYCPLIWLFCSKPSNSVINKPYEGSLRVILNDKIISFAEMPDKNIGMTKHQWHTKSQWRSFSKLWKIQVLQSEGATGGVLWEKVFLENSQNSQENNCARVSF